MDPARPVRMCPVRSITAGGTVWWTRDLRKWMMHKPNLQRPFVTDRRSKRTNQTVNSNGAKLRRTVSIDAAPLHSRDAHGSCGSIARQVAAFGAARGRPAGLGLRGWNERQGLSRLPRAMAQHPEPLMRGHKSLECMAPPCAGDRQSIPKRRLRGHQQFLCRVELPQVAGPVRRSKNQIRKVSALFVPASGCLWGFELIKRMPRHRSASQSHPTYVRNE